MKKEVKRWLTIKAVISENIMLHTHTVKKENQL